MVVLAILVVLAAVYWLSSLAYRYLADPAERARLNKRPGLILVALLAAASVVILLIGIYSPYGGLSVLVGDTQFRIWIIGLIGSIIFTAVGFMMQRR